MPAHEYLNVDRRDRGSHTTITLAGELDLDTAPPVRAMVQDCLRAGIRSIDLDLTTLSFCDVSGLNAFLAAAAHATGAGASLSLLHPRPEVIRLLDLTGTGFLLATRPLAALTVLPQPSAMACLAPTRLLAS